MISLISKTKPKVHLPSSVRTSGLTSVSIFSSSSRMLSVHRYLKHDIPKTAGLSDVPLNFTKNHRTIIRSFSSSTQFLKDETQEPPKLGAKEKVKESFRSSLLGKVLYKSAIVTGSTFITVAGLLTLFFIYDATTYSEEQNKIVDLAVSSLALNPKIGGPENLPILESHLDQYDSVEKSDLKYKPKLVVLGCGWGAVSLLKNISPEDYNVTVISPTNYFLFTPMLPCATVGTVEIRSLVESIRRICQKINAYYVQGSADKVELSDKLIKVTTVDKNENERKSFYVPYDKLIVSVGSTTNTHGVEGLQYSNFLKTVEDAKAIRTKIIQNLEKAALPTTSDTERKQLLSFVICGGGPTGVEFAAEVYDLLNENLINNYPNILRNEISLHIIQSRSHILNTYEQQISEYAQERFKKDSIDILTNSRVQKITPESVVFSQKTEDGKTVVKEIPFGLCLWSTGVSQNPLVKSICGSLEAQTNKRAIETDSHLRVIGAPLGDVYAIGDCSTVKTDTSEHVIEYIRTMIINKFTRNGVLDTALVSDDRIQHMPLSYKELDELFTRIKKKNPQTAEHICIFQEKLAKYDVDNKGFFTFEQTKSLLEELDSKVTSLPATAQRANQQGKYLGQKLTKVARLYPTLKVNDIVDGDIDDAIGKPFKYHHLGSLAYIGNAAVFDLNGQSYFGGLTAMYLWRSVYFAQSVSFRSRVLLFMDWIKRGIFGRDVIEV